MSINIILYTFFLSYIVTWYKSAIQKAPVPTWFKLWKLGKLITFMMKVLALISGGKDSCFNMMQCVAAGHDIVALGNLYPVGKGN